MANTIPPVLVELQLETANIKAQMAQVNKNFEQFGATVSKQTSFLSKFKATAAGVFSGNLMTSGMQAIQASIRGAIVEAQEYEKVTAQLNAGIASTGNLAGLTVAGLQEQAAALESLSAQDEIAIMKNQALLQTFTNVRNVVGEGNNIFDQASLAILNMGAKMGDNAGSAMQLGKALNDPIRGMGALRRVGVVFTAEQEESIKTMVAAGDIMGAQKVILQELEVEFGGAAAAAGDTFAGAIFRAKDKVGDFSRTLIANLQPILLSVGKVIGDLWSRYLTPLFKIINDNKEALLAFVGVLGAAYAALKLYGVILGVVKAAQTGYAVAQVLMSGGQLASIASTNGLAASMLRLNAIMTANPVGLIVAGIALLAAGFVIAWNHSETFRKVVVKGLQIVLNGVGYLVGAIAKMIGLFAKIPGMGWAKGIADGAAKAATDIRKVSDGLDGLANKKIKIPGFGASAATAGATGAEAPGGGITAQDMKDMKKAAQEKAKDLAKAREDVKKSYAKMNEVITEARKKSVELETDYHKEVSKISQQYADKELAIRKNYANKAIELEVEADKKRASIIQRSRELLTNAFASGTKIDLGKLFEDSDKSGAGLVAKLKEKYAAIAKLQRSAGALASAGFTQTFIQDVVSQGPEAGNAMAEAILQSTPEAISEMQNLFIGIESISKNGLNTLAEQMSTSTSFATQELLDEYENVGVELKNLLTKNTNDLTDALATNQQELQDALLAAQTAYKDAIDKLEKDTKDKLATLQDELRTTAETIRQLSGAKAAAGALAASPAAPILANTSNLGLAGQSSGTVIINNNANVSGINLTDPQATATTVSNAMRFGSTQGITTLRYRPDEMEYR